jgi:hypothetical protein
MSKPYYKSNQKTKINPTSNKTYELSMYMRSGGDEIYSINNLVDTTKDSWFLEGESIKLIYDRKKIKADNKHLL